MALIKCGECNRDISDQATVCPGCGAPVVVGATTVRAPDGLSVQGDRIVGTRDMLAGLAKAAVQAAGYRVDAADDAAGTVTFTTGMTMGSWTGVSGTIIYREVAPYQFELTGAAKQNVRGGQVVALDLFGEAKGKVDKVIDEMRRQASSGKVAASGIDEVALANSSGCMVLLLCLSIAPAALVLGRFV